MSWKKKTLGSLVKISKGKKYSESFSEKSKHRYINIEDLHGENLQRFTNEDGVTVISNDVIIAWDGANAGKVGVGFSGVIGSTLAKLSPTNGEINSKYLFWYLDSINAKIKSQRTGATIPHVNGAALKDLQIPLPPLHIQKQIANILDKADALRKKDQQLLQKYDELAQAIFIDMFGDPVKNEKGWEIGTIRELASEVKYGTSKPAEEDGEYPYLRMNNITYLGEWDFSSLKYISVNNGEKDKYSLRKNDLVFNRTNSKELVGKTAVYDRDEEVIIAGYLIRVRLNEKGNPFYVSAFLNSKYGKTTLLNMCKSIVGMANINAQELQNIRISIPPIEVQNNYEIKLRSLKCIKNLVAQSKSELLFQSLLQKAFTGELIRK